MYIVIHKFASIEKIVWLKFTELNLWEREAVVCKIM